jgi:hypothetical protein
MSDSYAALLYDAMLFTLILCMQCNVVYNNIYLSMIYILFGNFQNQFKELFEGFCFLIVKLPSDS